MSFEFSNNPLGAREDFRRARRRAALQEIVFQFKGKSSDLLSYDDVVHKLKGLEVSAQLLKSVATVILTADFCHVMVSIRNGGPG